MLEGFLYYSGFQGNRDPWKTIYKVIKKQNAVNYIATVADDSGKLIDDPKESAMHMLNSFFPQEQLTQFTTYS